jgi:hypothetical protein
VRHPIKGVSALDVSMRLAKEMGVVTLPASFFGFGGSNFDAVQADAASGNFRDDVGVDSDRWIRFSIANVNEESLRKVSERLLECERTFAVR